MSRILSLVLLTSFLVMGQSAAAAPWTTPRGDIFRSALQPDPGATPLPDLGVFLQLPISSSDAVNSPYRDLTAADVDGSPGLEIIMVADSRVAALRGNGALLWSRGIDATYVGSPVLGDLTGDGSPDIAFMTFGPTVLHVLSGKDGEFLLRLRMMEKLPPAPPLIVDLDGDGRNELVYADEGSHVTAARLSPPRETEGPPLPIPVIENPKDNGWTLLRMWSVDVSAGSEITTFAYGDVDLDGDMDVVAAAVSGPTAPTSRLVAVDSAGRLLWSRTLEVNGLTVQNVGDFHESPGAEIVVRFLRPGESEGDHYYRLLDSRGGALCNLGWGSNLTDSALALDADGDGRSELVFNDMRANRFAPGLASQEGPTGAVLAWRGCSVLWAQPLSGEPMDFSRYPVAADLDGDHSPEIVTVLRNGDVYVLDVHGNVHGKLASRPGRAEALVTGLAIVDLGGDGSLEVLMTDALGALTIMGAGSPADAPRLQVVALPAVSAAVAGGKPVPGPTFVAGLLCATACLLLRRRR